MKFPLSILRLAVRAAAFLGELLLLRERRRPAKAAQEAREAVAKHDDASLNAKLEDARLKSKSGRALLPLLALLATLALLSSACVRTLVVPADRQVRSMSLAGVQGWFVPDATMAALVEVYCKQAEIQQQEVLP